MQTRGCRCKDNLPTTENRARAQKVVPTRKHMTNTGILLGDIPDPGWISELSYYSPGLTCKNSINSNDYSSTLYLLTTPLGH